ncbi:MAG: hypothetical protein ACRDZ1_08740 [Acidimicrobiia bacterium]
MRRQLAWTGTAALALVAVLVLAGSPWHDEGRRWDRVVAGLCEVAADAREGNFHDAQRVFDRAHDELHVLAQEVGLKDPGVEVRLLEAKEDVQADLDAASRASEHDLRELVRAIRSAVVKVGDREPSRCSS